MMMILHLLHRVLARPDIAKSNLEGTTATSDLFSMVMMLLILMMTMMLMKLMTVLQVLIMMMVLLMILIRLGLCSSGCSGRLSTPEQRLKEMLR